MEVEALNLPVIFLIQPRVINDESGYFVETVNKCNLAGQLGDLEIVQDNQAMSGGIHDFAPRKKPE